MNRGTKTQLTFTGRARDQSGTLCKHFSPHAFKKTRCKDCNFILSDHSEEAVTEEQISAFIEIEQSNNPANSVIESPEAAIFLGGFLACSEKFLTSNRITHVVNTARGLHQMYPAWSKQVAKLQSAGIQFYCEFQLDDTLQQFIEFAQMIKAIEWVHTAHCNKKTVLIHCAQGKSRSATLMVAYLMATQQMKLQEAITKVRQARAIAEPNENFMKHLTRFEHSVELEDIRKKLKS